MKPVFWFPLNPGWIKLNTDSAAWGYPGNAVCRGVFRNCRGFVKGCFSFYLPVRFVFKAKLQAIIFGVYFTWNRGWREIYIKSNPSFIVLLLKNKLDCHLTSLVSLAFIMYQLTKTNHFIYHIFREGNIVANELATFGLQSSLDYWWHLSPDFIRPFFVSEYDGLTLLSFQLSILFLG